MYDISVRNGAGVNALFGQNLRLGAIGHGPVPFHSVARRARGGVRGTGCERPHSEPGESADDNDRSGQAGADEASFFSMIAVEYFCR